MLQTPTEHGLLNKSCHRQVEKQHNVQNESEQVITVMIMITMIKNWLKVS